MENRAAVLVVAQDDPDLSAICGALRAGDAVNNILTADSVSGAITRCHEVAVDVVVFRLGLRVGECIDELQTFIDAQPDHSVIVVTGPLAHHLGPAALRIGALNFVPDDDLDPIVVGRLICNAADRRRDRTSLILAAEQAREAERRRELIARHGSEGYILLTRDGRVMESSRPAGTQSPTEVGQSFDLGRMHPDDRRSIRPQLRAAFSTPDTSVAVDARIEGADGGYRWFEFRLTNYLDEPSVGGVVVNFRDVTERRRELEAIRIQADLLDAASQGIIGTDEHGDVSFWNKAAEQMYGWTATEARGRPINDLIPGEDSDVELAELAEATRHGRPWSGSLRTRRRDGTIIPIALSATPLIAEDGRLLGTIGVSTDLSESVAVAQQRHFEATHDPLTTLPNRVALTAELSAILAEGTRKDVPLTIAFVDIDDFRKVNDAIGYEAGDQLLIAIGRRLREALAHGIIYRFEGDQFVAVSRDDASHPARQVPALIQQALIAPFFANGAELVFTASIGAARAREGQSADSLIRDAGAALNFAKQHGHGHIEWFDATLRERAEGRLSIERALRRATERNEFVLHYQPIVAIADDRPVGFEALIRWSHPDHGMIPPDEFIGVAEETGLIVPMGEWAIREAIAQLAEFHRLSSNPDLWVAINMSTRQLGSPTLLASINEATQASGVPASLIHFEVTETALMEDIDASVQLLNALKDLGAAIAVDDFGTGYSSLMYLKRLPVDLLKIDRSFVAGLGHDAEDLSIVRTVVSLGHALDLRVLAEGVENLDQLEELARIGCDLGQGYWWGRPLPAREVPRWLASRLVVTEAPLQRSATT
jgi:diguanylate cyclase (GGDEF)-like protein/PAS domain S-box-containing protein